MTIYEYFIGIALIVFGVAYIFFLVFQIIPIIYDLIKNQWNK